MSLYLVIFRLLLNSILKDLEDANTKEDSLELGDSWRGMPRRKEGVANKTNGLYRRSVVPQLNVVSYLPQNFVDLDSFWKYNKFFFLLFQNKLYNIIVEKQPPKLTNKQTNSNATNDKAATQSQKAPIPSVKLIESDADDLDSFSFTQFVNGKNVSMLSVK